MDAVLQRLRENQLFVKAEKCEFHTSSSFCVSSLNRNSCLQIQRRCLLWLSSPLPPLGSSFSSSWALFYSKLQQSSGSRYTINVHLPALPLDRQGGQHSAVQSFCFPRLSFWPLRTPATNSSWRLTIRTTGSAPSTHSGTPRTRSFIPVPFLVNISPQLR